jgi:hypothetical protein
MASIKGWTIKSIFILGATIGIVACNLPIRPTGIIPAITPTPTIPIVAVEVTPAQPMETTVPGKDKPIICPSLDFDPQMSGKPCIVGSQESTYDITTQVSDHQTDHVVSPLSVKFELWAINANQLSGTAHLTYSMNGTETDSESTTCPLQESAVDQFSWDVKLHGQYFARPDGGIQVFFQTTPGQGPAYTEKLKNCQEPDQQQPGINWSGLSGELSSGVFDYRQENPMPANSSGEFYTVIHMEASR